MNAYRYVALQDFKLGRAQVKRRGIVDLAPDDARGLQLEADGYLRRIGLAPVPLAGPPVDGDGNRRARVQRPPASMDDSQIEEALADLAWRASELSPEAAEAFVPMVESLRTWAALAGDPRNPGAIKTLAAQALTWLAAVPVERLALGAEIARNLRLGPEAKKRSAAKLDAKLIANAQAVINELQWFRPRPMRVANELADRGQLGRSRKLDTVRKAIGVALNSGVLKPFSG